jgi:type VI secretion system protein ImpH
MAAAGWRSDRALIDSLLAAPQGFDVFQAVRLLEAMVQPHTPVGAGATARSEVVRFRGSLSARFPASDIDGIAPSGSAGSAGAAGGYDVVVNFLNLAGAFGPLPPPIGELVLERIRAGDTAGRDFLDIFLHRLVSLLVRVRRAQRPELGLRPPWESNLSGHVASFAGFGQPALRHRLAVPDRALWRHAALLGNETKSLHGLERLLSSHFGVPVTVSPLQGRWSALEPDDLTTIGRQGGQNHALGRTAVAGRRVWDQTAGIRIQLGPLNRRAFSGFLPRGTGHDALRALIALYAGPDLDITLTLVRAATRGRARLGRGAGGPRLGWNSVLGSAAVARERVIHLHLGRLGDSDQGGSGRGLYRIRIRPLNLTSAKRASAGRVTGNRVRGLFVSHRPLPKAAVWKRPPTRRPAARR